MPSVYNKNRVTKKGYNLLAESVATKKPVTFTKVIIGDGDDNGLNIDTMTNVVSEKLTLPVHDGQKDGDGQYLVTAILSNSTVKTGFFPKEVALFAKCGDGEEILYSYSNGGNNVGLIPDKNTPINSEIYNIRTKIGNATNITFLTSDDLYVTKSELTKHNADANAHDNRFNAIIQQLNNIITSVDNSDSLAKAPTLQLVKTLLSGLNIKNATDVVNALESEKATGLGIRYDFSNVNAWYICLGKLFGNLIIQGGKVNITVGRNIYNDDTVYPIAFNNPPSVNVINIADTLDQDGWVTSAIKSITNLKFTYITAQNSVTGISWIAIGN